MMIDSKSYGKHFENAGLEELLSERDGIIEFMKKYENRELPPERYSIDPNPEVAYFLNMEYLVEICHLIKIRMQKDDFYEKSCRINTFRWLDEYLSKLDDYIQKEHLEMLKKDDKKLYDEFMEWKNSDMSFKDGG